MPICMEIPTVTGNLLVCKIVMTVIQAITVVRTNNRNSNRVNET